LLLALAAADDLPQPLGLLVEVEVLQALLNRRGAHAALEVAAEAVAHLAVEQLVALKVLDLEVAEAVPHLVETVQLALGPVADLLDLALGGLTHLAALVALCPGGLQLGEVLLQLLLPGLDLGVAALLDLLPLYGDLGLERGQVALARVG